MRELKEFLKLNDVEYKEEVKIADYSPIKIGGVASITIFPDNEEKLILLIDFLRENGIKYKILGRMSNILFPDCRIDTVLIKTDKLKGSFLSGNFITLCVGEKISAHTLALARKGYSGILKLSGIPGSVGGMLRSNAGAFGEEIKDSVESAIVYLPSLKQKVKIDKADMRMGYRSSVFQNNDMIILSAKLHLKETSPIDALFELEECKAKRIKSQPTNMPSLGSIFKRPVGDFAARLIDASGLRGYSIGGAMVSEKHAGFIVNSSHASSSDVRELINHIKKTVKEKFGVLLQEEIEIL